MVACFIWLVVVLVYEFSLNRGVVNFLSVPFCRGRPSLDSFLLRPKFLPTAHQFSWLPSLRRLQIKLKAICQAQAEKCCSRQSEFDLATLLPNSSFQRPGWLQEGSFQEPLLPDGKFAGATLGERVSGWTSISTAPSTDPFSCEAYVCSRMRCPVTM